jgi:hypothetical protein
MIRTALCFLTVSGFLSFAALAQEASAQEVTGMKLEDSGFKMKEARSEKQMMRLKSLPARKFVRRTRNGVAYYIYADPDYCKCAYIGNQRAMDDYRVASAPVTGLPGYSAPGDLTRPSGDNVESDMITDMGEDGDVQGEDDDDDIFNPGLSITIPLLKSQ